MHEIESLFAVGTAPWHRLGTTLPSAPDIETGLKLAGFDWQVQLEPIHLADSTCAPAMATVRDVDRKLRGVVWQRFRLFEHGRSNASAAPGGTWWVAFNAVTEHLAHECGRHADRRLDSLWFGEAANLNRRALDVTIEMAR